ncbi:MAG TPA: cation-translocating P-type ATPase [Caldilineaceae bacterium]|nr:cation-translocating P-type ATPase [Caldilineaceae bacterium]
MSVQLPPADTAWHTLPIDQALSLLQTDAAEGLSNDEAQRRLAQVGPNELVEQGGVSPWQILWSQLTSIMVVVLIIAGLIAAFLGDLEDTIVIFALVVINSAIGFYQEYNAERAMAALKEMAVPSVRVRREGVVREIPAPQLAPGDIVLLEAGNRAPADGRLVSSAGLQVQEAALTGESAPVAKLETPLEQEDIALGDRRNMVYMGTEVTTGRGEFVVTATGMATELGKIANLIQSVEDEQTPLQRRLDQLGKQLAALALVIVVIVFAMGYFRGDPLQVLLLTAISLAVAAVPEGLPATVTIALSLGAQRMLQRRALIRKLPAVETLGSVTTICSDKTGTLTENRMTVTVLDIAGNQLELHGAEALPIPNLHDEPALAFLLAGGALCNDAKPQRAHAESPAEILGDPTEVALVVASNRQGMHKSELDRLFPRVAEAPFDSKRKRMTTLHRRPKEIRPGQTESEQVYELVKDFAVAGPSSYIAFTKGAVDGLLEIAAGAWMDDRIVPLDEGLCTRILDANAALARKGLRVLGVGFRLLDEAPPAWNGLEDALEREIVLVGMVGMMDPARPEAREAVQTCKEAGIHVKMITGDHPATAAAIARELGIDEDGRAVTGQELDRMSDSQLSESLKQAAVFARVAPEHKLRIVKALQAQGEIVAMTGDGVNDAPALKQAEIGVAMGITGTDVSKEAADMVLLDDNFATIVAAVREGRVVYANIRKFIRYLLTGNVGEIFVMLISPLLGMPLALLPLQILWINLLTDGLPALALGVEPAERDVMRQPPRSPTESILGRGMGWQIGLSGALLGLLSLIVGFWAWRQNNPDWQTMVFTTLTFGQMAAVLSLRSDSESVFRLGVRRNPWLLAAVALTVVLQLAVTYVPFLQRLFETRPLSVNELLLCIALGLIMLVGVEIEKTLFKRAEDHAHHPPAAAIPRGLS